jgi:hypothetical protein
MGTPPSKPCPKECNICKEDMKDEVEFYDFKTIGGPWADGCEFCFDLHGLGLGTGKGQRYNKQDDGTFLQTAGGMFTRGG